MRRPDCAQDSASWVKRLSRHSILWRWCSRPSRSKSGGTKTSPVAITRARLHALKNRRVEQFSLDALVELALRLELTVRMSMTRPYRNG